MMNGQRVAPGRSSRGRSGATKLRTNPGRQRIPFMRIESLKLAGFRAHTRTDVTFRDGLNLLIGPNGAGKTNLLEAIHVLCLSRSFLASNDRYVLQRGSVFYEVEGHFVSTAGKPVRVRVAYKPDEGKKVFLNGAPLERLTDLVGRIPVVVFAPDDQRITSEGPDERRRFLDTLLCQASPTYLESLMAYRRALKQRNEMLTMARKRRQPVEPVLLSSWTEELIRHGVQLIVSRIRFVKAFNVHLAAAYARIADVAERPTIEYEPFPGVSTDEDVANAFRASLEQSARSEQLRGVTQTGPHRDELSMLLDGHLVRRYGSQGQHRTFGMALKLAQYDYMHEATDEHPLLLLDDVFDNLDPGRIRAFLKILESDTVGQSITTAARREIVHAHLETDHCTTLTVAPGAIVEAETSP